MPDKRQDKKSPQQNRDKGKDQKAGPEPKRDSDQDKKKKN